MASPTMRIKQVACGCPDQDVVELEPRDPGVVRSRAKAGSDARTDGFRVADVAADADDIAVGRPIEQGGGCRDVDPCKVAG